MTLTASDIITQDAVEDMIRDKLGNAGIFDPQIDQYQDQWGETVFVISANNRKVKVSTDTSGPNAIDDFAENLEEKLDNLVMSVAPTAHVGDHRVTVAKHDMGLVARCNHCGVTVSMDEDRYANMLPNQQEAAKKWAIGFFARDA